MKRLAQAHIAELEEKLNELQTMKATLEHLVHCCNGDDRPDCPIIETLSRDGGLDATAHARNDMTAASRLGRVGGRKSTR